MTEIIPGTSDGAAEKHAPVIAVDGNKVTVTGSVAHPMLSRNIILSGFLFSTKEGHQEKRAQSWQTNLKQNLCLQILMKLLQHMITAIFIVFGKHKSSLSIRSVMKASAFMTDLIVKNL